MSSSTDSAHSALVYLPPHRRNPRTDSTVLSALIKSGSGLVPYSSDISDASSESSQECILRGRDPIAKPVAPAMAPGAGSNKWQGPRRQSKNGTRNTSINQLQPINECQENRVKTGDRVQHGGAEIESQLADWHRDWAPAPVEWEIRPKIGAHIMAFHVNEWMDLIPREKAIPFSQIVDVDGVKTTYVFSDTVGVNGYSAKGYSKINQTAVQSMGDIVPRSWIPTTIETASPQEFWQYYNRVPPTPVDEDDLLGVKAWWDQYPHPTTSFQLVMAHPELVGIDSDDESEKERRARGKDEGGTQACKRWLEMRKKRQQRSRSRRTSSRRGKSESQARIDALRQEQTIVRPKIDIFIRAAGDTDVVQLTDIYNHYVQKSCTVPDMQAISRQAMLDRLKMIREGKLPFLVACLRTTIAGSNGANLAATPPDARVIANDNGDSKPYNRRSNGPAQVSPTVDTIVGFAHADDYNDSRGMYRFVAELEMYIHPDHLRQNVAKCLMDQTLSQLDQDHVANRGYDVPYELTLGTTRAVTTIMLNMSYAEGDKQDEVVKWIQGLGFAQKAELWAIGVKLGKSVNLAIFEKKTGKLVDPANPPISRFN